MASMTTTCRTIADEADTNPFTLAQAHDFLCYRPTHLYASHAQACAYLDEIREEALRHAAFQLDQAELARLRGDLAGADAWMQEAREYLRISKCVDAMRTN